MSETKIMKHDSQAVQKTREPGDETIYIPAIDIIENNEYIRLLADMPGVDQKSVDVTVENNVLSIEGHVKVDGPKGYELVGREYGVGRYRRDFTISTAVDTGGIKARVQYGVLEVVLPKREELKTRKIEITS